MDRQPFLTEDYNLPMHISAVGIGQFGSCCTGLINSYAENICCHEILTPQEEGYCNPLPVLDKDSLLFLITDMRQSFCPQVLTACIEAAASANIQTVVIGPDIPLQYYSSLPINLAPPYCVVTNPISAMSLVSLVNDLANTFSFVGIDHGDIKVILSSGDQGVFASSEASGPDRGGRGFRQAFDQLYQSEISKADCRGAIACLYGAAANHFEYYQQALTERESYFNRDINLVLGFVVDERLSDSIRVTVLAMH